MLTVVDNQTSQIPSATSHKRLKPKHELFINAYILTSNASESARRAGYSAKNASITANKILKKPQVIAEIERIRAERSKSLEESRDAQLRTVTKETLVDKAMKDYEDLPVEATNRIRALELAGKATGIIGSSNDSRPNQTLIVISDTASMSSLEKLAKLRALIDA